MDSSVAIHTLDELQEMMEIRKKIEALQARYEEITMRPLMKVDVITPKEVAVSPTPPQPVLRPVKPAPAVTSTPEPAPKPPEPTPAPIVPAAAALKTVTPPIPTPPAAAPAVIPVTPIPTIPTPPATVVQPSPSPLPPAATAPAAPAAPSVTLAKVQPAPPMAAATKGAEKSSGISNSIAAVITASGKALTFDEIYSLLEEGNYTLPSQKPKLVVRRALFIKANFKMVGKDVQGQGKYEVVVG